MSGTARKIIYVMLVIVVLLIIWQFLGSLWTQATREAQWPRARARVFRLRWCRWTDRAAEAARPMRWGGYEARSA